MAKTRQQIKKRFREYGLDRKVTDQDISNVKKHGIGIIDETFGGVPSKSSGTPSAAQAGQMANTVAQADSSLLPETPTPEPAQAPIGGISGTMEGYRAAVNAESEIGSQQAIVEKLVKKGLEAKQQTAPVHELERKARKRLGQRTLADYEGMSFEGKIQALARDRADDRSRISYYRDIADSMEEQGNEFMDSFTNMLNTELAAAGLRVQREGEMMEMNAAASGGGGGGGGGGSRKSSSEDGEEADLESFYKAASYLNDDLSNRRIPWGNAWNSLQAQFPKAPPQMINEALGGEWNPETGENTALANVTPEVVAQAALE